MIFLLSEKGDVLCEMRFYVPSSELDNAEEAKRNERKKQKKAKEEEKGKL